MEPEPVGAKPASPMVRVEDSLGFVYEATEAQASALRAARELGTAGWRSYVSESLRRDPSDTPAWASRDRRRVGQLVAFFGFPEEMRADAWFALSGAEALAEAAGPHAFETLLALADGSEPAAPASYSLGVRLERQIVVDLPRTFTDNRFFRPDEESAAESAGGADKPTSLLPKLQRVLRAYCVLNPPVNYLQSMNFIAGFLLLVYKGDEVRAFWTLHALVSRVLPGFFEPSMTGLRLATHVFHDMIRARLPEIAEAFEVTGFDPAMLVPRWLLCGFLNAFPAEVTARLWDFLFLAAAPIPSPHGIDPAAINPFAPPPSTWTSSLPEGEGIRFLLQLGIGLLRLHRRPLLDAARSGGFVALATLAQQLGGELTSSSLLLRHALHHECLVPRRDLHAFWERAIATEHAAVAASNARVRAARNPHLVTITPGVKFQGPPTPSSSSSSSSSSSASSSSSMSASAALHCGPQYPTHRVRRRVTGPTAAAARRPSVGGVCGTGGAGVTTGARAKDPLGSVAPGPSDALDTTTSDLFTSFVAGPPPATASGPVSREGALRTLQFSPIPEVAGRVGRDGRDGRNGMEPAKLDVEASVLETSMHPLLSTEDAFDPFNLDAPGPLLSLLSPGLFQPSSPAPTPAPRAGPRMTTAAPGTVEHDTEAANGSPGGTGDLVRSPVREKGLVSSPGPRAAGLWFSSSPTRTASPGSVRGTSNAPSSSSSSTINVLLSSPSPSKASLRRTAGRRKHALASEVAVDVVDRVAGCTDADAGAGADADADRAVLLSPERGAESGHWRSSAASASSSISIGPCSPGRAATPLGRGLGSLLSSYDAPSPLRSPASGTRGSGGHNPGSRRHSMTPPVKPADWSTPLPITTTLPSALVARFSPAFRSAIAAHRADGGADASSPFTKTPVDGRVTEDADAVPPLEPLPTALFVSLLQLEDPKVASPLLALLASPAAGTCAARGDEDAGGEEVGTSAPLPQPLPLMAFLDDAKEAGEPTTSTAPTATARVAVSATSAVDGAARAESEPSAPGEAVSRPPMTPRLRFSVECTPAPSTVRRVPQQQAHDHPFLSPLSGHALLHPWALHRAGWVGEGAFSHSDAGAARWLGAEGPGEDSSEPDVATLAGPYASGTRSLSGFASLVFFPPAAQLSFVSLAVDRLGAEAAVDDVEGCENSAADGTTPLARTSRADRVLSFGSPLGASVTPMRSSSPSSTTTTAVDTFPLVDLFANHPPPTTSPFSPLRPRASEPATPKQGAKAVTATPLSLAAGLWNRLFTPSVKPTSEGLGSTATPMPPVTAKKVPGVEVKAVAGIGLASVRRGDGSGGGAGAGERSIPLMPLRSSSRDNEASVQ